MPALKNNAKLSTQNNYSKIKLMLKNTKKLIKTLIS
jgi:hypothetical protein